MRVVRVSSSLVYHFGESTSIPLLPSLLFHIHWKGGGRNLCDSPKYLYFKFVVPKGSPLFFRLLHIGAIIEACLRWPAKFPTQKIPAYVLNRYSLLLRHVNQS